MSAIDGVSETFDADQWDAVPGFDDLTDLTYHRARAHGTVRIAFDRPDVLNAFRPHTVDELLRVLEHARMSSDVGCVLLTGNGPGRATASGRSAVAATSGSAARPGTSTRVRRTPRAERVRPPSTSTGRSSGGCTSWSASG